MAWLTHILFILHILTYYVSLRIKEVDVGNILFICNINFSPSPSFYGVISLNWNFCYLTSEINRYNLFVLLLLFFYERTSNLFENKWVKLNPKGDVPWPFLYQWRNGIKWKTNKKDRHAVFNFHAILYFYQRSTKQAWK